MDKNGLKNTLWPGAAASLNETISTSYFISFTNACQTIELETVSIVVNQSCGYPESCQVDETTKTKFKKSLYFCRSIGRKLSSLMYTNGEDDWSDLGLEKTASTSSLSSANTNKTQQPPPKKRVSLPATIRETPRHQMIEVGQHHDLEVMEDKTAFVKSASRTPGGSRLQDGYGEGVPVLNRKTSAPVMPYGSPRTGLGDDQGDQGAPAVRRKSSELSNTMKTRLEAFTNMQEESNAKARTVEPDETFREKLLNFRKISEPQMEDVDTPKGPKPPPLSYKTLIGSNFSQSNSRTLNDNDDNEEDPENLDDVDQLLDDALEESYNQLEDENENDEVQS
jgi:hypothetical protein